MAFLSYNLQWLLVFLYANSLYESIFLESLSLAYNEVNLYLYKRDQVLVNLSLSPIVK